MLNQLKGGALISYISIFANNVIGLLYTPFLIRSLGSDKEFLNKKLDPDVVSP